MVRASLLPLLLAVPLSAQDPRGAITGTVSDSSAAVIPGAAVAFTQTRTGVTLRFTTNAMGVYEANYVGR